MVGHRLTLDDFEGFVVFKSQRVLGGGAFVWDFGDFRKCGLHRIVEESSGESGMNSPGDCKQVCIMSEPRMY
jgi:hypothetical protein